jgi:hypothetical protein
VWGEFGDIAQHCPLYCPLYTALFGDEDKEGVSGAPARRTHDEREPKLVYNVIGALHIHGCLQHGSSSSSSRGGLLTVYSA